MSNSTNKPNIFNYAAKELSQDAVICWLIKWAYYSGQGYAELRNCGKDFVEDLFKKHGKKVPQEIKEPKVWQQNHNIDVLVRIGDYVLLIEDKTGTKDHSGQLKRYYESVRGGKTAAGSVTEENILPIYLKTGNQSLFARLRIENLTGYPYKVFNRSDLLKVVERYQGAHSILDDFRDHLKSLEDDTQNYREWGEDGNGEVSYRSCQGLFRELENQLCVLDSGSGLVGFDHKDSAKPTQNNRRPNGYPFWGWDYVPNRAGGFIGFWWYYKTVKSCGCDVEIYLQLEMNRENPKASKLCFKVRMQEINVDIKRDCRSRIKDIGGDLVCEPKRIGHGYTVTIAEWKNAWLVFNKAGVGPDIQEIANNLINAQNILDRMG